MDEWFIVQTNEGHTDVFMARNHFCALMRAVKRFGGVKNLAFTPRPATPEELQSLAHSASEKP